MAAHGIEPFDLVVVNLYPFGIDIADFAHGGAGAEDLIDIGGPAMIRAAAKNHASVGVLVDPADYPAVLDELRADGRVGDATRRRLARTAFALTAAYDAAIAAWFDRPADAAAAEPAERASPSGRGRRPSCPSRSTWRTARAAGPALRREPPPAGGAVPRHRRHRRRRAPSRGGRRMTQHGGLALSYLNLYDADAAWLLVHDLAVTVRPAGRGHHQARQPVRRGGGRHAGRRLPARLRVRRALRLRRDRGGQRGGRRGHRRADGGRRPGRRGHRPGYAPGTVEALPAKRKNTRILEAAPPAPDRWHLRPITGGLLVQDPHRFVADRADWRVVTAAAADRGRDGRRRAGLAGVRLGEVQRHRAGQGRRGLGHRRRPAEPGRVGRAGRVQGRRPGRGRGVRQRRLLPLPRRHRGRGGRRRGRRHPARRARCRDEATSPGPTSWAWPWSSPASATSSTEPTVAFPRDRPLEQPIRGANPCRSRTGSTS